jgi:hypothetical protein
MEASRGQKHIERPILLPPPCVAVFVPFLLAHCGAAEARSSSRWRFASSFGVDGVIAIATSWGFKVPNNSLVELAVTT